MTTTNNDDEQRRRQTTTTTANSTAIEVDNIGEESSDSKEDMDDGEKKRSACHVSLGNQDLSNIVNGFNGDLLIHRPFDRTFTRENRKHHQLVDCGWILANDEQCSQRRKGAV